MMNRRLGIIGIFLAYWITGRAIAAADPAADSAPAPKAPVAKPKLVGKRGVVRAISSPLDPRLVRFPYTPDYVYPILTKLDDYTHIELAENERIVEFRLPDKLLFNFKVSPTKRDIYVKPVVPQNEAGATIITNLRRYELNLCVGDEDSGGTSYKGTSCEQAATVTREGAGPAWYKRVSWETEDGAYEAGDAPLPRAGGLDPLAALKANLAGAGGMQNPAADLTNNTGSPSSAGCGQERIQLDRLNFNYSIVGDAPFKPTMVFDDGRFTWFKFPKLQDVPPVFALDPKTGEGQITDFIPCKGHLVVQALMPGGALLKLGKVEIRIVNKNTQDCGGFFNTSCKAVSNFRDQ